MKQKFRQKIKNIINHIKINKLFFTFVLTNLLNGMLIRFLTVKNYFDIKPLLGDLIVILLIGSFGYLFKPKNQFKYFITFTVIFTVLCIINSIYYTNYLSYASFSLLATSLQIVDVGDAVVENIMELKDFTYLWSILAMIVIHIFLRKKSYYSKITKIEEGKVRFKKILIVTLITFVLFIFTLTPLDVSRFGKQWNREYVAMEFGLYIYQINDIIASLKPQISPLFGYDENAKIFRDYYETKSYDDSDNEYTDVLKDKNVIVIHAESIQNFLLNTEINGEVIAPNLRKLADEGLYFSNFYAQESVGTSSDTEFTFNTSLMPSNSGTVFVNYWDKTYETMVALLGKKDYYTFSMHANNCTFWNRNVVHKQFGYDNFYCYTKDYDIDDKNVIGMGLNDKEFFKQSVEIIKDVNEKHDKFYGLAISLTNHTPFTNDGEPVSDFDVTMKYDYYNEETGQTEKRVAPFLEDTTIGNYFKAAHYADEAIGEFINRLDKEGLLEDTAIVIYGDHDAKIKTNQYNKYYNYVPKTDSVLDKDDENYRDVDYFDYEINRRVPFIIWTKDGTIKHKEVNKVMGMYDVLPTLGNMLGINSNYAVGSDIFNVDNNLVVFPNGDWVTDTMYYRSQTQEGKVLGDYTVSAEEITKNNMIAEEKITVSNSIIVYDLIKKVNEQKKITDEVH